MINENQKTRIVTWAKNHRRLIKNSLEILIMISYVTVGIFYVIMTYDNVFPTEPTDLEFIEYFMLSTITIVVLAKGSLLNWDMRSNEE